MDVSAPERWGVMRRLCIVGTAAAVAAQMSINKGVFDGPEGVIRSRFLR